MLIIRIDPSVKGTRALPPTFRAYNTNVLVIVLLRYGIHITTVLFFIRILQLYKKRGSILFKI